MSKVFAPDGIYSYWSESTSVFWCEKLDIVRSIGEECIQENVQVCKGVKIDETASTNSFSITVMSSQLSPTWTKITVYLSPPIDLDVQLTSLND